MPFNPGVYDRSGEILAASIGQSANTFANTMQEVQKAQAEKEVILGQLNARFQAGMLAPEDYKAALQGNMNKARAMITQADASMLMQQKQLQQQIAQQGLALDQRGMTVRENQLQHDIAKTNNLGKVTQGRLADGTIVDINAGTGQVLGGVQRTSPAPNGETERFIKDPSTGKTIGYQVWNGRAYSDPHNVPAPNPMEALMGLGAPQQVPATATVSVQPNAPASLPRISTQAEYDALPSGAEYINAKTGARSRKP